MSDGDGLGFMGSLALGMIAADQSSREDARLTAQVFNNLRHRREIAAQEGEISGLIQRYNQLVQDYNYVFDCAKQWQAAAEKRSERITDLQQELAAANQRASDAGAGAADFKSRYEYYHERYEQMGRHATEGNLRIRQLEAEIERLKDR